MVLALAVLTSALRERSLRPINSMPQSVFPTSRSSTKARSQSSIARQSVTDSTAATSASTFALGTSGRCRPRRRSSHRANCQRWVKCWHGMSRAFPIDCKAHPCGVLSYGVFKEIYAWFLVTLAQWRIYLLLNLSRLERMTWSLSTQAGLSRESKVGNSLSSLLVIPKKGKGSIGLSLSVSFFPWK